MKLLKKLFPALALCCLLVCLMPKAEAATTSGKDGNINWSYDDQTGVLSLTGTGTMRDYNANYSPFVPWRDCDPTSVVIGDGITSVGDFAFSGMKKLVSVTFGKDITKVGEHVFEGCTALESVSLNDGLTKIGLSLFFGCSSLKTVVIPDTVASIDINTFQGCSSLTEVNIPSGLKNIPNYMFYGCSSLTTITIPDTVTTIGVEAFKKCSSLTAITLPKEMTKTSMYSFDGCTSLKHVFYEGTEEDWNAIDFGSSMDGNFLKKATIHYYTKTSGTCGDNLTWEFDAKTFTLTISGSGDMYDYNDTYVKAQTPWYDIKSAIRYVVFPEQMTSIGKDAFENCTILTAVEIPAAVKTIGDSAFKACAGLETVTLNDGVTELGMAAFADCPALKTVDWPQTLKTIKQDAFIDCELLETADLPQSLTSLQTGAFSGCSSLNEIVVPNGISVIEESVFSGCSSLQTVTIPAHVEEIAYNAFFCCSALADVYYHGTLHQWNEIEMDIGNEVLSYATLHTLCDDAAIIAEYEYNGNGTHTVTRTCSKCEDVLSTVKELCADENTDGLCDGCGEVYVFHAPNCYEVLSLTIRDASGEELTAIPSSGFYAEVQLKKLLDADPVVAVLATYTAEGQLLNTYFMRADVPTGSSYSLGAWIGNADGRVGKVSVFLLSSLGNPLPIAEAKFVAK